MRILVVDDDAAARETVRFQLADFGHEVDTAGGGHEAMLCLGAGRYEVIITDLEMPDIDGLSLCQLARGLGYSGEWILMTGAHTDRRLKETSLPVLHKPFRCAELLSVVDRARAALDGLHAEKRENLAETGVRATPRDLLPRRRCNQT